MGDCLRQNSFVAIINKWLENKIDFGIYLEKGLGRIICPSFISNPHLNHIIATQFTTINKIVQFNPLTQSLLF